MDIDEPKVGEGRVNSGGLDELERQARQALQQLMVGEEKIADRQRIMSLRRMQAVEQDMLRRRAERTRHMRRLNERLNNRVAGEPANLPVRNAAHWRQVQQSCREERRREALRVRAAQRASEAGRPALLVARFDPYAADGENSREVSLLRREAVLSGRHPRALLRQQKASERQETTRVLGGESPTEKFSKMMVGEQSPVLAQPSHSVERPVNREAKLTKMMVDEILDNSWAADDARENGA